jgi:hypothetical protein
VGLGVDETTPENRSGLIPHDEELNTELGDFIERRPVVRYNPVHDSHVHITLNRSRMIAVQ